MSTPRAPAHTRLLALAAVFGFAGWALAQAVPPGFIASPEIYKVIAENDRFRVVQVVWKPGQKDTVHSHPDSAVYYLTDCQLRNEVAGSPPRQGAPVAGTAAVQRPIAAHTVQNIGSGDCRLIMFESK